MYLYTRKYVKSFQVQTLKQRQTRILSEKLFNNFRVTLRLRKFLHAFCPEFNLF